MRTVFFLFLSNSFFSWKIHISSSRVDLLIFKRKDVWLCVGWLFVLCLSIFNPTSLSLSLFVVAWISLFSIQICVLCGQSVSTEFKKKLFQNPNDIDHFQENSNHGFTFCFGTPQCVIEQINEFIYVATVFDIVHTNWIGGFGKPLWQRTPVIIFHIRIKRRKKIILTNIPFCYGFGRVYPFLRTRNKR